MNLQALLEGETLSCKICGQSSPAIRGQGEWATFGKSGKKILLKCLNCGGGAEISTKETQFFTPETMVELQKKKDEKAEEFRARNKEQVVDADFSDSNSWLENENAGKSDTIIIPPQVKLIPVLATIIGIVGLFGSLPLLFWVGSALCVFNLLVAMQWRTLGSGLHVILCIAIAKVAYLFLDLNPSLLEIAASGLLLWTTFHMLFILSRKSVQVP